MSEFASANKGQAALQASDYPAAITHLTQALNTTKSPLWLIWRATAYQRTGQQQLALADADNAVLAAVKRSKRDLIATAQFRRAVALHGLKRYGDARMCLHWVKEFNDKEKGLTLWQAKIFADFEKAGGDEAECNQVTVKKIPDEVKEVVKDAETETKDKSKAPAVAVAAQTVAPTAPVQTPREKIRHEWYQSPTIVTVTIFAKGVPKENTEVKIDAGSVSAEICSLFLMLKFRSLKLVSRLPATVPTTTRSNHCFRRSIPQNPSFESHHKRSRSNSTSLHLV
jgi:suppressor of G2 allele of SKP1